MSTEGWPESAVQRIEIDRNESPSLIFGASIRTQES